MMLESFSLSIEKGRVLAYHEYGKEMQGKKLAEAVIILVLPRTKR